MTAFWCCYGLYIAPGPEGTRICLIGANEEGKRFQQVFDDAHFREFIVFSQRGCDCFVDFQAAAAFSYR